MCRFERFRCAYHDEFGCKNYSRVLYRAPCFRNVSQDLLEALACWWNNFDNPPKVRHDSTMWTCKACRVADYKDDFFEELGWKEITGKNDNGALETKLSKLREENTKEYREAAALAKEWADMAAERDGRRPWDADQDEFGPEIYLLPREKW